jgi:chemotaxis protein methyltransferase CheR
LEIQPGSELLSPREFDRITKLVYRACGIDLKQGKLQMVQARLRKIIRHGKFGSFNAFYQHVAADNTGQELIALLDALTTNFTSFMREPAHFDFLRETILPAIKGEIRIWSSACSTGEEPFTIAFSLLEELGMEASPRAHILATDISTRALAAGKQATYPAKRFDGLSADWRRKYLMRGSGRWEGWYRVKPLVRGMIEFRRLNLMEPIRHPQLFHVIFCRNVMIYFNKATQEELVNRLAACLEPGGYLLTGIPKASPGLNIPTNISSPLSTGRGRHRC